MQKARERNKMEMNISKVKKSILSLSAAIQTGREKLHDVVNRGGKSTREREVERGRLVQSIKDFAVSSLALWRSFVYVFFIICDSSNAKTCHSEGHMYTSIGSTALTIGCGLCRKPSVRRKWSYQTWSLKWSCKSRQG